MQSALDFFEIRDFLEEKYSYYNRQEFIKSDPIQIPHQFTDERDIEISSFLTASIAWGRRVMIIRKAYELIQMMDNKPAEFLTNASLSDLRKFNGFQYRTFLGVDTYYFLKSLQNIYNNYGGLKEVFESAYSETGSIKLTLIQFRKLFFSLDHYERTRKHVPDPEKSAAAKRLNMFLRWMVRKDDRHVDFGIWKRIPASNLLIPLDIHTGNVARKLGLLSRKQNDWKAVEELTSRLRQFDTEDPSKYDFALFGLGVFEGF